MNIIYVAQFHETCGYSHAAIGYLNSISSVIDNYKDVNFKILSVSLDTSALDLEKQKQKIKSKNLKQIEKFHILDQNELDTVLRGDYICIWHMTSAMPVIEKIMNSRKVEFSYYKDLDCNLENIILGAQENYHILAWETDNLPGEYSAVIENYKPELLIAPCEWNKKTFQKSFNSVRVPHLIEQKQGFPEKVNIPGNKDKFTILSMSEWIGRKNFKGLIRSYISEFRNCDDTLLVIKTNLPLGVSKEEFLQEFREIKNSTRIPDLHAPQIVVILDYLSDEKIKYLYEKSDVFCITSLGEGFSIPTADAAAMSKPVICPRHGGHVDFLPTDNKYFIDGIWDSVYDTPPYDPDGLWFKPTVISTRNKMRLAYEDWKLGTLKDEGAKNQEIALGGDFSRESIGNTLLKAVSTPKRERSRIEDIKLKIRNLPLQEKISYLKDSFKDEDCYILNCGPSLSEQDPEKLKNFLKDKLTFTVKQSFDLYKEISDFHFFNCSNLPNPKEKFEPYYENLKDTITVSSSNYEEYQRWQVFQSSDIFFKIPIRTEIDNEFLVKTGKIEENLLKNKLTRPCGPGIMYETVLFMAIHLGVKSIKVLGWDLTMDKVTEKDYKHFYGSTDGLINRGDILDWEIEETRKFSKDFYNWCLENNISLSLVSSQSSLYSEIPREKLEL